ncbi:hypothetical protein KJ853_01515 [Patescibacteria group bacterium]|nr:hypothetical protein [Patescibacteria group bacterium]
MNLTLNNSFKKTGQSIAASLKKRANFYLTLLLLICVLAAGAVLYFYVIKEQGDQQPQDITEIKTGLYQNLINQISARELNIQEGISREYTDIFK